MSAISAMPSPATAGPDPHGPDPHGPDAHGQAALLLVESLIHGLVGAGRLSLKDAVGVTQVALDAQIALADLGRSRAASTDLLEAIHRSLEIDLPTA